MRKHHVAGQVDLGAQVGDGVDQRVQARGGAPRRLAHEHQVGLGVVGVHEHGFDLRRGRRRGASRRLGAPRSGLARLPRAMCHDPGKHESADDRQADGEVVHAASAMPTAVFMSTATMRETPCSCIVTPTSCSAISIAILLWLMKRNCVPCAISLTSAA